MRTIQDANLDVLLATLTILQSLVLFKFAIKIGASCSTLFRSFLRSAHSFLVYHYDL